MAFFYFCQFCNKKALFETAQKGFVFYCPLCAGENTYPFNQTEREKPGPRSLPPNAISPGLNAFNAPKPPQNTSHDIPPGIHWKKRGTVLAIAIGIFLLANLVIWTLSVCWQVKPISEHNQTAVQPKFLEKEPVIASSIVENPKPVNAEPESVAVQPKVVQPKRAEVNPVQMHPGDLWSNRDMIEYFLVSYLRCTAG